MTCWVAKLGEIVGTFSAETRALIKGLRNGGGERKGGREEGVGGKMGVGIRGAGWMLLFFCVLLSCRRKGVKNCVKEDCFWSGRLACVRQSIACYLHTLLDMYMGAHVYGSRFHIRAYPANIRYPL